MNNALALLLSIVLAFAGGVWFEKRNTAAASAGAAIEALKVDADRNERVVDGWAHAVDYLRTRLRNGDAPRIPVPATPGAGKTPGTPTGPAAPGVPLAGELAICRAEREQLIVDGAQTMIDCKWLQEWAR